MRRGKPDVKGRLQNDDSFIRSEVDYDGMIV